MRFLYARAWVGTERPSVLFDLATAWLLDKKVLLLGVTTLTRLISTIRERVAERLWQQLSTAVTVEQRQQLAGLLTRAGVSRITNLERLRRSPSRASAPVLVGALARLSEVRQLDASSLDLTGVPPSRIKALAHYAVTTKAQNIASLTEDRRTATLVSFARTLTVTAQDDALDVLDMLMRDLLARSARTGRKERLRTLRDLDTAALYLAEQTEKVITPEWTDEQVRTFLKEKHAKIAEAVATIYVIARPPMTTTTKKWWSAIQRSVDFFPPSYGPSSGQAMRQESQCSMPSPSCVIWRDASSRTFLLPPWRWFPPVGNAMLYLRVSRLIVATTRCV